MHRISLLTLLVLSAVNAYLIFSRDWDPIDAWLFVGGSAIALTLTVLLSLVSKARPRERKALLREMAMTAKAELAAFLKRICFWR